MKKATRTGPRLLAAALCSILLCAPLFAARADIALKDPNRIYTSLVKPDRIVLSELQLYVDDVAQSIKDKTDYSALDEMIGAIQPGHATAEKSRLFESESDKNAGIVKIQFDIAAEPSFRPLDVLFVLDESGSMHMYAEAGDNANESAEKQSYFTSPCMNEGHYYDVTYTCTTFSGAVMPQQHYRLEPEKYNITAWNLTENYLADLKADIAESRGDCSASNITMNGWGSSFDFGAHHYMDNGTQILKPDAPVGHVKPAGMTGNYYSPASNNASGCIDRAMFAKDQIMQMAASLAAETLNDNKTAFVNFASVAGNTIDFAKSDLSVLKADQHRFGYDFTNYKAALDKANGIIGEQASQPASNNRLRFVLFITDGWPNKPDTDTQASAINAAKAFKAYPNTYLFCLGIRSGASSLLKQMAEQAGDINNYLDCDDESDFQDIMGKIGGSFTIENTLSDEIGGDFDLICDTQHPINVYLKNQAATLNFTQQFTSLSSASSAPEGVTPLLTYDAASHRTVWSFNKENNLALEQRGGIRLTFYVRLKSDSFNKDVQTGVVKFPTNGDAKLEPVVKETGTTLDPTDITTPADIRLLRQNVLTAVKSSPTDGKIVTQGQVIDYAITLTNSGPMTLNDVAVADRVPVGTEYVSGGTLGDNRYVRFSIPQILPGGSATVAFSVRVKGAVAPIVNAGLFGLTGVNESFNAQNIPVCTTNTIINPLSGGDAPPATGDDSPLALWLALAALSVLGLLCMRLRKNRNNA